MERARCKPWGLYGGLSGHGNAVAVHRFNAPEETRFPSAKALNQVLQAGDAYIIRSGGGGGYGSPLERDLATLERDVRCGYVTKEAAENHYGAVFEGETLALDLEATKAHRADMQRQGLPHDEPITEIIIPFPTAPQAQARLPEHEKMTEEERVAFAMQCRCCR
jgi:N-methylhydantoinase B